MKIISGGQTGADRIALEAAAARGFETGGTAPLGFRTENGPDLSLQAFGLVESSSSSYEPRTRINILDSDGTALFGDMQSPGSRTTIKFCKASGRPYITNPTPNSLLHFIYAHQITVLNVAGNRASKLNQEQCAAIRQVLDTAFARLR